jgi:1D-myo-inositol 3-kinase
MSLPHARHQASRFDYTTIGHVTIDVLEDGTRRAGGTALYSALQASRLGLRTAVITRGVAAEIEALLEPFRGELELEIAPAPHTTTLATAGSGASRRQRMLAWAGPIEADVSVDSAILHLAPVARETPSRWLGRAGFVGLTPQGLLRRWRALGEEITLAPSLAAALGRRADPTLETAPVAPRAAPRSDHAGDLEELARLCQAIVLSEQERAGCAELLRLAGEAGAVVAVTAGPEPSTILRPGGGPVAFPVAKLGEPPEDLGAGDVFAAAFFVALAEGRSIEAAATFANAAAAVRLQGSGPAAIGGREAIDARARSGTEASAS